MRGFFKRIEGHPAPGGCYGCCRLARPALYLGQSLHYLRHPHMPPFLLETHPPVEPRRVGQAEPLEEISALDRHRLLQQRGGLRRARFLRRQRRFHAVQIQVVVGVEIEGERVPRDAQVRVHCLRIVRQRFAQITQRAPQRRPAGGRVALWPE